MVDRNSRVPRQARLASIEAAAARAERVRGAHADLSGVLRRLREECHGQVRSAIGATNAAAYDAIRERTRQRLADLASSTRHTTESLRLESAAREAILAEAKEEITPLALDTQRVEQIYLRYRDAAWSAVEHSALIAGRQLPDVADPSLVPRTASSLWTTLSPPYDASWGSAELYRSSGTRIVPWGIWHGPDHTDGRILCDSRIGISGADDSDEAYTWVTSEQRFWYQMPVAGHVEVWLYLEPGVRHPPTYAGSVHAEWGWSNSGIVQWSRPYLRVIAPEPPEDYFPDCMDLVNYRRGSRWGGDWVRQIFPPPPPNVRSVHLWSSMTYPAGQWVHCAAGLVDLNYFWVNDMSCQIQLGQEWYLRRLAVRSNSRPF